MQNAAEKLPKQKKENEQSGRRNKQFCFSRALQHYRAIQRQGQHVEPQNQHADKWRAKNSTQARRQPRPDSISQRYQRGAYRDDPSAAIQACRQTELVDHR